MSKYNNGGRAFPTPRDEYNEGNTGMSIRAYFAGQAMAGELASQSESTGEWGYSGYPELAKRCVAIADALIEELNR